MNIISVFKNKTMRNAGWIIGGKLAHIVFSFLIGILTARYLGPSNQGLISYAGAFTVFACSLCTLGINSIIVKDFVDNPEEEGCTIGTTLVLRLLSSIICFFVIGVVVSILDRGEKTTILVVLLCSLGMIFSVFDTFNYWFQKNLQSKYSSIASLVGYIIVSLYKIFLLIYQKSVLWFAIASSIDYIIIAIFLWIIYNKNNGPKLSFSLKKAKQLLGRSYHFILSGLMISVYGATDKLMLKQILDEAHVGYYSTAVSVCNMWCFILSAIIQSVVPSIMKAHGEDEALYNKRNKQLYAIIFYISFIVSLFFSICAEFIIGMLYGKDFLPAVKPLRIVTWYTAFSYLGVARDTWIVCENKQKYLKYLYAIAAVGNVVLNAFFIPLWGGAGAALASLITQILTTIFLPFLIKALRPNGKMMLQAICLQGLFTSKG